MTREGQPTQPYRPPEAERHQDYVWLAENIEQFAPLARDAFATQGRGMLWVDTTVIGETGGNPIFYAPESILAKLDDADTQRLVRDYDPLSELVVYLVKGEGRTSAYRLRPPSMTAMPVTILN